MAKYTVKLDSIQRDTLAKLLDYLYREATKTLEGMDDTLEKQAVTHTQSLVHNLRSLVSKSELEEDKEDFNAKVNRLTEVLVALSPQEIETIKACLAFTIGHANIPSIEFATTLLRVVEGFNALSPEDTLALDLHTEQEEPE